jgi:serine/threonine-protein kinase HipA
MGRPSHTRALDVWANGILIGRWKIPIRGPMSFTYDAHWVESDEGRPLSLSLPIALDAPIVTGERVANYFENLLPDSDLIRRRIQTKFAVASREPFALLAAIGKDCVGAVQLLEPGQEPDVMSIKTRALTEPELENLLRAVPRPAVANDPEDELRISLAGAQEKTALTKHRGRWCLPLGSTPTTHIFKLPLGLVGQQGLDLTTSVENEWLCGRILAACGLPVAHSELLRFGTVKALVVTRFDRKLHDSRKYWLRLPQEDFCQATGIPSAAKYEAEGGPGIVEIAKILNASEARELDLATFLRTQLLFWLLAAIDGHAKNFSLHLLAQGRYRLTPLYDVTSAWPVVGSKADPIHEKKLKLAMALKGKSPHYRWSEIQRRHFNETARLCGLGRDMESIIETTLESLPRALDRIGRQLPLGFPEHVFVAIKNGALKSCSTLAKQPA